MALKSGSSSFSCVANSLSAPFRSRRSSQLSMSRRLYDSHQYNLHQLRYVKDKTCTYAPRTMRLKENISKRQYVLVSVSENSSLSTEDETNAYEEHNLDLNTEDISTVSTSFSCYEENGGKSGLISFYKRPYKKDKKVLVSVTKKKENSPLWFVGPAVLAASLIFPSLYLRKILCTVFEDSLLTDFLILFFTEALFYSGVAIYLFVIDCLRRPVEKFSSVYNHQAMAPQLWDRISSVIVLVLSLTIPMVTMGFVWPWTGPAASATLAPYLVGIVVQFAFEQYGRYIKSPSLPTIPIIFLIYRLHQLNRAAQLVTALSFTVRGVETTPHSIAINSSLGTLLNVLQFLGVICIWSLSSFIMKFSPSPTMIDRQ